MQTDIVWQWNINFVQWIRYQVYLWRDIVYLHRSWKSYW